MIARRERSCGMKTIASLVVGLWALGTSAQEHPRHALGVQFGTGFYPEARIGVTQGGEHARFPFDPAWGASVSYRRMLSTRWSLAATGRLDRMAYYLLWSGNMESMGHWAVPGSPSIGLPPDEFNFGGLRVDLGYTLLRSGKWSMRSEAGVEALFLPLRYFGYSHHAELNGQYVPYAARFTTVLNEEELPVGRIRLALAGVYTDRRWNEWSLALAAQLSFRKDVLRGAYTVLTPTGTDSGTFTSSMNAIELVVGRYFSWGRPKMPRWAQGDGAS
jgi:hypothetical protein